MEPAWPDVVLETEQDNCYTFWAQSIQLSSMDAGKAQERGVAGEGVGQDHHSLTAPDPEPPCKAS